MFAKGTDMHNGTSTTYIIHRIKNVKMKLTPHNNRWFADKDSKFI